MRKILVKNQKGMALVTILVLLILLSLIGSTALFSSNTGKKISANYRYAADALQNADAGIADAARQILNKTIVGNGQTGWNHSGTTTGFANSYTVSYVTRTDNGGARTIAYDGTGKPYYQIDSVGYSSGANGVEKKIRVVIQLKHSGSTFDSGIFGDEWVALKGQGYVDSFDSNAGAWTAEGARRNGHVGTNAKGSGVINLIGQSDIYGNAIVGPGGTITDVTTSGQAEVLGEKTVASEKKDMTPKQDPGGGIPLTLSGTMTIPGGEYRVSSVQLSGQNTVTINGNVTLYVDGNFKTAGQSKLKINEGASLTLYVDGNIDMAGQGIVNLNQKAEKVLVYGTESCQDVKLAGQSVLYAAIYAPKAMATFTGQADIFGSVITKNITVTGQGSVHYDEALRNQGGGGGAVTGYKMISWKES
jgi:type II secretory pathway pseudopilin PulG